MMISHLFSEKVQTLVSLGLERPLERRLRVSCCSQRQSGRALVALGGGRGRGSGVPLRIVGQAREFFIVDVAVFPFGHGVERERVGELHLFCSPVALCGHVRGYVRSRCRERERQGAAAKRGSAHATRKKKRGVSRRWWVGVPVVVASVTVVLISRQPRLSFFPMLGSLFREFSSVCLCRKSTSGLLFSREKRRRGNARGRREKSFPKRNKLAERSKKEGKKKTPRLFTQNEKTLSFLFSLFLAGFHLEEISHPQNRKPLPL